MMRPMTTACLMAVLTVVANAQDRDLKPVAEGTQVRVTKLSALMKSKILIQDDQPAGQITDIVLSDNGCVDYVVASYEEQYYVIPYSAVTYRNADRIVYVDIAPTQFRKVAFFTGNQWPDFYAAPYQQTVFNVFNVTNIRRDGPRSTLKPNLDDDRDNKDRPRDKDRDGKDRPKDIDDKVKDKIKDNTSGEAKPNGVKKPNPGVVDPPKTDPDAKNTPKTPAPKADLPKTDVPKVDAPKPNAPKPEAPKAELPKPQLPKSDKPRVDPLKPANPKPAQPIPAPDTVKP